jgi:hypothetical protein
LDIPLAPCIIAKGVTNLTDDRVDIVFGVDVNTISPEPIRDLLAADHSALIFHQVDQ